MGILPHATGPRHLLAPSPAAPPASPALCRAGPAGAFLPRGCLPPTQPGQISQTRAREPCLALPPRPSVLPGRPGCQACGGTECFLDALRPRVRSSRVREVEAACRGRPVGRAGVAGPPPQLSVGRLSRRHSWEEGSAGRGGRAAGVGELVMVGPCPLARLDRAGPSGPAPTRGQATVTTWPPASPFSPGPTLTPSPASADPSAGAWRVAQPLWTQRLPAPWHGASRTQAPGTHGVPAGRAVGEPVCPGPARPARPPPPGAPASGRRGRGADGHRAGSRVNGPGGAW